MTQPDPDPAGVLPAEPLETVLDVLRDVDRWFDGWCPTATCCAHTGAALHERVRAVLAPALAAGAGDPHRCSGCGHRWAGGPAKPNEWTGAELCGDCWRIAQPVLHRSEVAGAGDPGSIRALIAQWRAEAATPSFGADRAGGWTWREQARACANQLDAALGRSPARPAEHEEKGDTR